MRQVRIFAHISLDGVIQPPGDGEYANGGWTAPYRSAAGAEAVTEAQGKRFDLLLGRRTYDMWSSYWPKVKGGPFADALNGATKYVATHRPDGLEWGPVGSLGPDVIAGIRGVKSKDGPDLVVWGSTTLTPVGRARRTWPSPSASRPRQRHHVAFWRAADLVRTLIEARDERSVGRLMRRLERVEVVVLDEVGLPRKEQSPLPTEHRGGSVSDRPSGSLSRRPKQLWRPAAAWEDLPICTSWDNRATGTT